MMQKVGISFGWLITLQYYFYCMTLNSVKIKISTDYHIKIE